jgi:hypothetical protein
MAQPCPCRGCTAAYKAGRDDQREEWQDVLTSTNRDAADRMLDKVLDAVSEVFFHTQVTFSQQGKIMAVIEDMRGRVT